MSKITINDVRVAIFRICQIDEHKVDISQFSDEKLLKCDFYKDLRMGNIRVINVFNELQRIYNINLPLQVFKDMPDNTVGAFITSVNNHVK